MVARREAIERDPLVPRPPDDLQSLPVDTQRRLLDGIEGVDARGHEAT